MARPWLSIRVDLVEGRGELLWPRPGRIFAAARQPLLRRPRHRHRRRVRPLGPRAPPRVPPRRRHSTHHALRRRGRARPLARRPPDEALAPSPRRAVPVHVRPGRRLDPPVHCRRGADRSAGGARDRARPARCRSSAGERSPTSTGVGGTATISSTTRRPIHAAPTCHRCAADGGVPPAVEQEAAGHRRAQLPQRARRTWSARTATAQLARWPAERGVYGR